MSHLSAKQPFEVFKFPTLNETRKKMKREKAKCMARLGIYNIFSLLLYDKKNSPLKCFKFLTINETKKEQEKGKSVRTSCLGYLGLFSVLLQDKNGKCRS